ncbi:ArnT family glycosyltransferase [Hymenobacter ruricola]|uniref:Glycosyltransferase family 39 protein n=1 Tax=Hymenobacter ruricola TaxID=2791023 RepID=A0ABS0I8H9_9BACT|nr:glycosyltransferase family 39 protein [Hymenobacter ruricola]MBF9223245.1 glycosyltransferase family 39 protein [Hymenobacter ruricola]
MQQFILIGLSGGLMLLSGWRYQREQRQQSIAVLMAAALTLRIGVAGLDPFLHSWDERFHALVAKNLLDNWMRPVLHADPVLPYDYQQWCCNSVWLHKQPLFLWQIATSFRYLGVSEFALRLPSALLGAAVIWPVYRLGCLIFNAIIGYHAGVLFAMAYYSLELTSGWQSVDHADVAFMAYVTGSLWAYYECRATPARAWRWAVLTGLLAGAAVLCKWLPGLVVYAAWGADVLVDVHRRKVQEYGRLLAALAITLAVALPWQVYIRHKFPLESAFEQEYAARHFSEVLEDKGGPWYFYITNLWYQFQWIVLPIAGGFGVLVTRPWRPVVLPLLLTCGVVFAFFSCAATKMVSYTYAVAPVLLLLAALGWVEATRWLNHRGRAGKWGGMLLAGLMLFCNLRPTALLKHHSLAHTSPELRRDRQRKLQHTEIYRQLDALVPSGYVVLNAPPFEDVEAMFYSRRNVYWQLPSEQECQNLRSWGEGIAVFIGPGCTTLPKYLQQDASVLVIKKPLD